MYRFPLLVVVALCAMLIGVAPANAEAPPTVTIQPTSAVVEEPAYTDVVATWTPVATNYAYAIEILDQGGSVLARCGAYGNSRCSVRTGGWQQLHDDRVKSFSARVVDGAGTVFSQVSTSVTFKPHKWQLNFAADAAQVEEPANVNFVTTIDSTSDSTSPYAVQIRDANETVRATCNVYGNLHCSATTGGWLKLHDPLDVNWHAVVISGTDPVPFARVDASASISPHKWTLSATSSPSYVEVDPNVGWASVNINVSVEALPSSSPYAVRVVDADSGAQVCCTRSVYGNPAWSTTSSGDGIHNPVRHFRAEIIAGDDPKPFATATTSAYFHNPNADMDSVDGFNFDELATMFAAAGTDPCTDLALIKENETHFDRATINDASMACDAAQAAGLSLKQILQRVAAVGGGTLVAWFEFTRAIDDGTPWSVPIYQPEPPATLPDGWATPLSQAAARIRALNPELALNDAQVDDIAKRCAWLAAQDGLGVAACGQERLPIFVSGSDVFSATTHDAQALGTRPAWMRLNYVDETNQIGGRGWYDGDTRCADADNAAGTQCDEFPYFSTSQGGGSAFPVPSLKVIDKTDNTTQGSYLRWFYTYCAMRSGVKAADGASITPGDAFLVVPVPFGVPTINNLCNGKSASNQP